jgi:hypothetical protein
MLEFRNIKEGDIAILKNRKEKIEKVVKRILFTRIEFVDGTIMPKEFLYKAKSIPVIYENKKFNLTFTRGGKLAI